jgi:malate synthase
MEDAATAEISRAQLWQWIYHKAMLNDGRQLTAQIFDEWMTEELGIIESQVGLDRFTSGKFSHASSLFSDMIKEEDFDEFLTIPAYSQL